MLIVSNWKAYVAEVSKAKALVAAGKRLAGKNGVTVVLAPPMPYLGMFVTKSGVKNPLSFGAQDLSASTSGASTGEVSAQLLTEMGVTHVILGHSERRAMGETDGDILLKMQHALAQGLIPILCIGEGERDTEAQYLHFVRSQLSNIFEQLTPKERTRVIIAYEPIWAIGKSAAESITPQDLHEMALYIRKVLSEYLSTTAVKNIQILYGGSVEPGNIRMLAAGSEVAGFLVGHASTDVATFTALLKALA